MNSNFKESLKIIICYDIKYCMAYTWCAFLKDFYRKCENKPKIFGLTASLIKRKGKVTFLYVVCFIDGWRAFRNNLYRQ